MSTEAYTQGAKAAVKCMKAVSRILRQQCGDKIKVLDTIDFEKPEDIQTIVSQVAICYERMRQDVMEIKRHCDYLSNNWSRVVAENNSS